MAARGEPSGVDREDAGADGVRAARARGDGGVDPGERGALRDSGEEGVPHPVVEHDGGLGLADARGEGVEEAVARRARGGEDEAGLGAELARAQGHGGGEPGTDPGGPLLGGGRGDHDRVEGAEFAVEGDRHGPGGGRVEERPAAAHGAGEAGRRDEGVADERDTGVEAVDEDEDVLGEAGLGGGPAQQRGAELGGGRVVGVALDHRGAAGREGARRVAAGDGEGEREVARRVDGDDAERDLPAAQVGPGRDGAGVREVDPDVQEGAFLDGVGEGPQLGRGAGEFAGEPDGSEGRLGVGGLHDAVAGPVEEVGGGTEEGGPRGPVGEGPAGGVRGPDGPVDLLRRGLHRDLLARLPRPRIHAPHRFCRHRHAPVAALNTIPADERVSGGLY